MAEVTYREGLGRPLTYQEADDNFRFVEEKAVESEGFALDAQGSAITAQNAADSAQSIIDDAVEQYEFAVEDNANRIRNIEFGDGPYPSLDLLFTGAKSVDPRIVFERATPATYFDETGVLRTAGPNEPRIDYDPATGECLGLLVEEAATNLLLWSEDLSSPGHNGALEVLLGSADIGVGVEALKVTHSNVSGLKLFRTRPISIEAGKRYTWSMLIKPEEWRYFVVQLDSSAGRFSSNRFGVDITTGETIGKGQDAELRIVDLGGGIFQLTISDLAAETGNAAPGICARDSLTDAWNSNPDPDERSYYLAAMQFEEGALPTSYIPTEGSQVTRAADSISMPVGDWYRPDQGTLIVDCVPLGYRTAGFVARLHKSSNEYIATPYVIAAGVSRAAYMRNGGGSISAVPPGGTLPYGDRIISAVAWDGGEFVASANGELSSVATQPDGPPDAIDLRLAVSTSGESGSPATIRSVAYYPRRLTDAQLIALTEVA